MGTIGVRVHIYVVTELNYFRHSFRRHKPNQLADGKCQAYRPGRREWGPTARLADTSRSCQCLKSACNQDQTVNLALRQRNTQHSLLCKYRRLAGQPDEVLSDGRLNGAPHFKRLFFDAELWVELDDVAGEQPHRALLGLHARHDGVHDLSNQVVVCQTP